MKSFMTFLIFVLLVFKANSLLPPEKREELLNKYTNKITPESFYSDENFFNPNDLKEHSFYYDVNTINGILKTYDFPQNYNFLEKHNITPIVKDQKNCNCCWSFASTSALAYRFKLKGLDVDLSPQDGLSCYLKDCALGNYIIDSQLNLIKNGTVTEQCLPFSSGDGQIKAECPKETCQDGSKVKRYFSQNAYSTEYFVTKNNYYDIVTLIIDQLINKGPVISNIYVCEDFQTLNRNPGLCTNKTIYRYDNKSDFIGGHVVVIVGYGFMDNKFYWQIQNSWGPNACDKGFIKIEFGQIGIENVAFSEPYLEEEGKEPYEIKLKYKKMEGYCNIEISLEDVTDIEKWENSLEINFESEDKKTNFNYQCGILNSVKVDKKLVCYYEYMNWLRPQNYFNYKGFKSLGKDNTFNLGTSVSEIKSFEYYGNYTIYNVLPKEFNEETFLVSEEGSKIILYFDSYDISKNFLPPIYANIKASTPLSNCKRKIFITDEGKKEQYNHNLIICELNSNEINYFDDYNPQNKYSVVYNILCGAKQETQTYGYKLDKNKYPVFKVKNIYLEKTNNLSESTQISFNTILNGTITEEYADQMFMAFADVEYGNKNRTYVLVCMTGNPDLNLKEHNMTCQIQIGKDEGEINYNNLYIHPYIIPYGIYSAYEVIMEDVIKKENEFNPKPDPQPVPVPTDSKNIELSFLTMLIIILLI